MSNVLGVAWRIPCSGLRPSGLLPSNPTPLRSICHISSPPWLPHSVSRRFLASLSPLSFATPHSSSFESKKSPFPTLIRSFSNSSCLRSEPVPPTEHGVAPRRRPFTPAEVKTIFGPRAGVPSEMGNRILAVLQGRRLNGTLDLDLPTDITQAVRPATLITGLNWLRANYPLDEDAAIMARIEREDREEEEKHIRQAEELGIYKPQSGTFGAKLGDSNDPYGRSVFQKHREQNEARLLAEHEKKRREWLEGEEHDRAKMKQMISQNTALQNFNPEQALAARPRADPQERPVLAWVQKHHLRAEENADFSHITNSRRILIGLAVTVLTFGLCYFFALYYQPPAKNDRIWPSLPPAAATVIGLIGINVGVCLLWKAWPPAWRILVRHFTILTANPRASSFVGNIFSHQAFSHLGLNMLVLWVLGTKFHDDVGRGNFLALYMASGVFGSFLSLTANVIGGNILASALGASGAISGIVAAFCMLHLDEKFTIFFIPKEWQETISAPGGIFLAGLVGTELVSVILPLIGRAPLLGAQLDHWAHIGGYLVGILWATAYKKQEKERRENRTLVERLFSNE